MAQITPQKMPHATRSYTKFIRDIARREVDGHQQRFTGLTASPPHYKDINGVSEFVCNVRIGIKEKQGLVQDVLIAQWAIGVITDINIPVIVEKSESGRLVIIARTSVRLPNVSLMAYSSGALGIPFISNLIQREDGTWVDAYGYPASDPNVSIEIIENWEWQQYSILPDNLSEDMQSEDTAQWQLG